MADPFYQGQTQGLQPPAAQSYQQAGYPSQHGYPQPQQPGQSQPASSYDEVEFEDEPPRKRRRWMIAAALVGSIAVGSGLAYVYKTYFGPKTRAELPTARAPTGPTKVPPSDRGGTRIPNQDSQLLNARVPAQGGTAAGGADSASSGFTDSNGVRRVPTVAVGPGGAVAPPPGMTIVGGSGPGAPTMIGATPPPTPAAVAPPQAPPRVAAVPTATTAPPPPSAPAAPQRRAPQPQPQEPEAAPPQQQAAAPPRPAAPVKKPITGFVAALGFHRTQLDAMKMMADLQQKYEVLRDKKLEIVQSDESSRGLGVIYRVVGPKGSASAARELCTQLKQAGMPDKGCYTLGM